MRLATPWGLGPSCDQRTPPDKQPAPPTPEVDAVSAFDFLSALGVSISRLDNKAIISHAIYTICRVLQ